MSNPGDDPTLDTQTQAPVLYVMSGVFLTASCTAVSLRIYNRAVIRNSLGLDDLLIVFSAICTTGVTIATILEVVYGLGRHVWMVDDENKLKQLKCSFAAILLYNTAQILTKLSFLTLYRRIFPSGRTRVVCMWLLCLLGAWGIAQDVMLSLSCAPVALFIPAIEGFCLDGLMVWYITSIANIATVFIVFLVPMPAIRKLQLRRSQKILIISLFGLGVLACGLSIARILSLWMALHTRDPTWDMAPAACWTVIELNVDIICACVTTLGGALFSRTTKASLHATPRPRSRSRTLARQESKNSYAGGRMKQGVEGMGSQVVLGDIVSENKAEAGPRPGSGRLDTAWPASFGGEVELSDFDTKSTRTEYVGRPHSYTSGNMRSL